MPRLLRLSIAAILAIALTGCFFSTAPLISPDDASPVLNGKTAYTLWSTRDGGRTWTEDEAGTISRSQDGYSLDGEKDAAFILKAAFGDYYVAQQADKDGYNFDLVRIDGDKVYVYHFACADDDLRYVRAGLIDSISGNGDNLTCTVSDYDKLVSVFRTRIENGALPKSLYVIR
jgi:hypothetical protein